MNVLKKKTDLVKSVSSDFVIRLGFEPKITAENLTCKVVSIICCFLIIYNFTFMKS